MKRTHGNAFPGKGQPSGYKRQSKGHGLSRTFTDVAGKYGPSVAGAFASYLNSRNAKSVSTFDPLSGSTTATSRGARTGVVKQDGMGGSVSKCVFYAKKHYISKPVKELMGRYVTELNGPLQLSTGVGRQNVQDMVTLYDNGSILTMMANGPDFNTNTLHPSKIYLESVEGELTLTNTRTANCIVTIYDVVARNDCNLAALQTPGAAWSSGETNQGSAITVQGAIPFNSEAFNQFYRVIQTQEFILAEGACHKHLFYAAPNKMFSSLKSAGNITNGPFRDLSCFIMVVARGAPANDSTTKSQVSSGVATLDGTTDYSYHYRFPRSTQATIAQVINLPQSFTIAEDVLNEAIGVPSGNTQA